MKKIGMFVMVGALLFSVCTAYGASLSFAPDSFSGTLEAGNAIPVPVSITLNNTVMGSYQIMPAAEVSNGNLPISWLTANPPVVGLRPTAPARSILMVAIPEGTAPGTYSGYVLPRVVFGGGVDAGSGIFVSIEVPRQMGCREKPAFTGVSVGPEEIRVPNNKIMDIRLAGGLTEPEGCSIKRVWYEIEDEYGEFSGNKEITVYDGKIDEKIQVMASRKGTDKDGRVYLLTVFAEDEAGVGEAEPVSVRVLHDNGKR